MLINRRVLRIDNFSTTLKVKTERSIENWGGMYLEVSREENDTVHIQVVVYAMDRLENKHATDATCKQNVTKSG